MTNVISEKKKIMFVSDFPTLSTQGSLAGDPERIKEMSSRGMRDLLNNSTKAQDVPPFVGMTIMDKDH